MVLSRLLMGALITATAGAHAQSSAPPVTGGGGTKMQYQSAFGDYRPFTQAETLSWKRANGDAAMLGGHMGQMKDDAMPATAAKPEPPATPPATIPAPASPGRASPQR